jgi:NADH-quinone oxidoreductase subunit G
MSLASAQTASSGEWISALNNLASAIGAEKGVAAPSNGDANDAAKALAKSLLGGERKAILLGNAAAHHPQASQLLAIAQWIGEQSGASVGYLTEAANTVGAQWVGAVPKSGGLNAAQMLTGGLKAVILLNNEPEFDSAIGSDAPAGLEHAQMVVTLSPFKANLAFSDVLLPIAPFTETPGTFVNAEGRVQSFHAVVKPQGGARPGWKVLRVLGNMLGLQGFDFESSQEVLAQVQGAQDVAKSQVPADRLNNAAPSGIDLSAAAQGASVVPAVAAIYQLDGLVRRATSLQLTADARGQAVRGTVPTLDGVPA